MSTTVTPRPPLRWRGLRRSAKLCVLGFFGVLLFGCLELTARIYWSAVRGVPVTHPNRIWRAFFPELNGSGIDTVVPHPGDDRFNVLLLGGSVLHREWGDVAERLQAGLEAKLDRKVRLVNLASPGRTSCDSRVKYEHLADKRFDLVIVYEGINDVYLNNIPPDNYRDDYSHKARFAQLNRLNVRAGPRYLMLPFTWYYLASSLQEKMHLTPQLRPLTHGEVSRTPPAFEVNLMAIADLAKQRGDPLLLLTFAYHIPPNYTEEAFQTKQLDYHDEDHRAPVCMWGEPQYVARTLDLHNEATRRVAARHPEAMFLDQAKLMPEGSAYVDPCHLSKAGCQLFTENVLANLDRERLQGGH